MLRFIPTAIVEDRYKWMANLWAFGQKTVYGDQAYQNSMLTIVKHNRLKDKSFNDVDWNLHGLPYYMVPSIWNYVKSKNDNCVVINVFAAVKPLLKNFNDDDTIVLSDMDVVSLKKYDNVMPGDDNVICYDGYEDWHMFIANPSKKNYYKIQPYLHHNEEGYMNGGFIPIFIKNKTLKLIIDDVIDISEKIIESDCDPMWKWWSCMTAFSIVCHNHKIKMISQDNTYIPSYNEYNPSNHYFVHYSVDKVFNKATFPNHDITSYPHTPFYNLVREWIKN